MKYLIPVLFALFLVTDTFAQAPTVFYLDHPAGGTEEGPRVISLSNGDFLLTSYMKRSNPDSINAIVTRLNASLDPLWSRIIRIRKYTNVASAGEEPDGSIRLLVNAYNTFSAYYNTFIWLNPQGTVVSSKELVDSVHVTNGSSFYKHIRFSDGTYLLPPSSSRNIVHLNAQQQVDWAKQPIFKKVANQSLVFQDVMALSTPGQWIGSGYIYQANLGFYARMQDSIALDFHVYSLNSNNALQVGQLHRYANGEVLLVFQINGQSIHLFRLTSSGNIIWKKHYKSLSNINLGTLWVDTGGDIWLSGSTQPLVAGLMAHFTPTGDLIEMKGQYKGGMSLGLLSGIGRLANNELFTFQHGYYNNSETLIGNKLGASDDFLCFNSSLYTIGLVDTTWTMIDSASTSVSNLKSSFSLSSTLSAPIKMVNLTAAKGPVVCTPTTSVDPSIEAQAHVAFPNPVADKLTLSNVLAGTEIRIYSSTGQRTGSFRYQEGLDLKGLPPGLYWAVLPGGTRRVQFVKE